VAGTYVLQILRVLRLLRLGRVAKSLFMSSLGSTTVHIPGMNRVSAVWAYMLQMLYSVAMLINFLGCLWCVPSPGHAAVFELGSNLTCVSLCVPWALSIHVVDRAQACPPFGLRALSEFLPSGDSVPI
jgi:hypothetical protein